MTEKKAYQANRDLLQLLIYKIINPAVRGMIRIGITPNVVTTIGLLGNIAAAILFIMAGNSSESLSSGINFSYMLWGGAILIVSSLFDMLDGQVARIGNMVSTFGAMYDSVLDRYSELVTLGGLTFAMMGTGYTWGAIITFVALVGSLMVSYVRARAEGLGLECKIGFMQRPERVVVTSVAALAAGIYGVSSDAPAFDPMMIVIVAMAIIAIFANITAFARIFYSKHQLQQKGRA
jgi:CDP-diacylglycerol--glycerol-3-phosphate 3-phosphatidyltransferase